MSHYDVIVAGTGLAGLTAATRLAEGGARVLVLAKGVGATHLSPCTIDVLGYAPERVQRPVEALAQLAPDHPYSVVGRDAVGAAIRWWQGAMEPYPYVGSLEQNVLLPTAVGALKPSALVPETMAAGADMSGPVCVVGLRALKDFHAPLLADNLGRAGIVARAVELDLRPEGRVDANSLGFARAFDDPAVRADVAAQLSGLGADERVAFPAVLGIAEPGAAWRDLQERLGRPVFEVPTLPPSVPGMRVFAILRERLRRAGGRVILNAVVNGAERSGGRVAAVRSRVGLRDAVHGCDWVVLATGGFASGGLELDSRWRAREVALGLPVSGVPAGERFRPAYFDDHPMGRAGVAVDRSLRPEGHENVLVVGATLAGAQPWKEKSGDGISVATGHRAAELILGAPVPSERAKAEA